jgi:nucleotide-binding universal stress UspA family protein
MATIDRIQRERADEVAHAGAEEARRLGAIAEPYPIADEADVAETLAALAERCDACAVVIGSRGLGGVRSRLFGSTTSHLLRDTGRPVVVVKGPA